MVGKDAAVHDRRVNPRAIYSVNFERDHAVIEQQNITGNHILVQGIECHTDAIDRTVFQPKRAVQEKRFTVFEFNAAVLEPPYTDLRALQVAHESDFTAGFSRGFTQRLRPATMVVCITMGKIQARDIEAGLDHFQERCRLVGRWSQRCDNLRSSSHGRDYCTAARAALTPEQMPVSVRKC